MNSINKSTISSSTELIRLTDHKSHLGTYAGFVSRFAAYVIDVVILAVLISFVLFLIDSSLSYFFPSSGFIATKIPLLDRILYFIESPQFAHLTGLTLIIVYYIFFWWAAGQTPGKALMGVKIVKMNGQRLSVYR